MMDSGISGGGKASSVVLLELATGAEDGVERLIEWTMDFLGAIA